MLSCDTCPSKACAKRNLINAPQDCPSFDQNVQDTALASYANPEDAELARNASATLAFAKAKLTRVELTLAFARISGYRKIGIAFCVAMAKEAAVFAQLLRENGFEPESIICKTGALDLDDINMPESSRRSPSICNPIAQAMLLNEAKTDLNVVIGLCVGHDSLFNKYSEAPVTCLSIKDSVTKHCPMNVLYEIDSDTYKHIHNMHLPSDEEIAQLKGLQQPS